MNPASEQADKICAIYLDMGTTNTRAWLMFGDQVLAATTRVIGIRDAARDGGTRIHAALRDLIAEITVEGSRRDPTRVPTCVGASGMITLSLGLTEVPHVPAPAGIDDLARSARWYRFPEVTNLPWLLVPGVRSGPASPALGSINQVDVMRGEETLCAGLVALHLLRRPALVLNLGSHWKAIAIDERGKIEYSITSLSGELIHVVQTQTVLAGSVSSGRPTHLSPKWIQAGMAVQRESGLPRALFCARLLDLAMQGDAEDRLAFVVGAVIASDLDALLKRGVLRPNIPVAIVGHEGIAGAWFGALAESSVSASIIPAVQAQTALLKALYNILLQATPKSEMEPAAQKVEIR